MIVPRRFLGLLLTGALGLPAQQAPGAKPQAPSGGLKIVVVEGEGARNNIRARTATAPVVEVRDAAGKPVSGAEVTFQLPLAGPGGTFHNWLQTQTVKTDANGRAAASGYLPNDQEGRFSIKVTASMAGQSASAAIAQTNLRGPASGAGVSSSSSRKWWITAGVIGAAALAGGIYAASRNGGTETATALIPVVITASPVTVGAPR